MLLSQSDQAPRHSQLQQLSGFDEEPPQSSSPVMASQVSPPPRMNPWEAQALTHSYPDEYMNMPEKVNARPDPLIFPGLYCPSGFDMMSVLLELRCRPHPEVDLGPVDGSVSLTVCDLEQPDTPIVYASPSFCELTGYSMDEVLGRNCRFLQTSPTVPSAPVDRSVIKRMSQAVHDNREIQLQLYNYKKNGQRFTNVLSIVPIRLGPEGHRYAVGLQCEV